MTALSLFDVIASLASIVSLAFASFLYHRDRLRETKERANVEMLKIRLGSIANNLHMATVYLQTLIRQADDQQTPVRELQNMARGVRATLLAAFMDARSMEAAISALEIGQLLKSHSVAIERDPSVDSMDGSAKATSNPTS